MCCLKSIIAGAHVEDKLFTAEINEIVIAGSEGKVPLKYQGEAEEGTSYELGIIDMRTGAKTKHVSQDSNFAIDKASLQSDEAITRYVLILQTPTRLLSVRVILFVDLQGNEPSKFPHDLDSLRQKGSKECLIGQTWSLLVPVLALPDLIVQDVPLLQVLSLRKPLHKLNISIISRYVTQNWILLTIYGKRVGKFTIREYRNKAVSNQYF
jgi:hypothetical protein